ncbi:hypothetical protein [Paenibacillus wulumuqiensis]|uniref:hypothetical protein n=1 Tax=Paenibacillus wulumuqiensis TaxID=1567107 RepID=UPI0006190C3C|nr:hypothetical protein [Paenibacillus wulumuqiensis]
MQLIIEPYTGVNEYRFGMTPAQIKQIAGLPDDIVNDTIMKQIRETYGPLELIYTHKKLTECIYRKEAEIFHEGIDLFRDEEVVAKLSAYDEPVRGGSGYMLFRKLGICLGGFHGKKIPQDRLVIVFSLDRLEYYEEFIMDEQ